MHRQTTSQLRKYRRIVYFAFTVAAVCWAGGAAAFAQGGGGPQLADADREAAWALQAKGVAASLGLEDENATKLADAYSASRKSLQEAIEKLPDTGGGGAGRFEAYRKVADEQRAQLQTALAGFLTAEQADKAAATLGTFSRQWDRMVHTLAGFNLEEEKLNKALDLVAGYVTESDTAMRGVTAQGDWQTARTKIQDLKAGLDTALADVLAEDQLATWKEATTYRGGRVRGGAGSGEGRGDRGGQTSQG
jgi:hypothetical protein